MQRTGLELYQRLQTAVQANGGSTRDALLPMQGYLQDAALQAELLGIPLDANTQMLIDQSEELGIWKEKGKTAQDLLIDGMSTLVAKVTELVDQFLGVSGAIAAIPSHKTVTIEARYIDPGPPPGFGEWGGIGGAIPMAEGGMGGVTEPTLFLAGEAGSEDVAFSGGGRRFSSAPGGASSEAIERELTGLRRDLARDRRLQPSLPASAIRDQLQLAGVV